MASCAPEAVAAGDPLASHDRLRVGEVVLAAAALAPAERESYLRQMTLSAPTLLAEVRRRLELAAALPESFLAIPAAELLEAAVSAEADGDELTAAGAARYELGGLAGEGGMAKVHRAFDRQLRRPVALKLLQGVEPVARARLLREAQAQARVRHDNVLEVYETGTLDGQPFIAMRWVDGPTLLGLRGQAPLEQQVRLVAEVAEGLHAAHREGLIHRDVKPSNVLVERTPDGGWKAWIADFGIALQSDAGPSSDLAGTPAYLAPELLTEPDGTVDRRADVYGLGATLYELLAGRPPFLAEDLGELLRQVRVEAPPPLGRLVPAIPADLAAIVHRCLEKDPAARYPSARALAEDLRRYLDGEVVEAHAANLAYRLTRFTLRHRRLLAVAGVAAVLLAAALAVAALLGIEARAANRRAELRRGQAEELLGFLLTDLRDRLEPLGKLAILDGVGERALRYFAAVPLAELSDEELARRSQALYQIGDLRLRRGDLAGAVEPLRESLSLAAALARRDPDDPERLFGLGQSHFWVGSVAWQQRRTAEARRHWQAYLALSERLVRRDPARADWQLELAYGHSNLGSLAEKEGRPEEALGHYRQALAINRLLVAREPGNRDWQFELAATHNLLGAVEETLGRLGPALAHCRADLALRRTLAAADPDDARAREFLATSLDYVAELEQMSGRPAAALGYLGEAQSILAALAERDSDNAGWRYKLGVVHLKLSLAHRARGAREAAFSEWRHLRAIARDLAGQAAAGNYEWRRLQGVEQVVHAALLIDRGEPAAARATAEEGIAVLGAVQRALPADLDNLRWLGRGHLWLATAAEALGDPVARQRALLAGEALTAPAAVRSRSPRLLAVHAQLLLALGRAGEARPLLARLRRAGFRDQAFWREVGSGA